MKLVVLHPYSLNIKQTYIKGFFGGGTAHTLNPPLSVGKHLQSEIKQV